MAYYDQRHYYRWNTRTYAFVVWMHGWSAVEKWVQAEKRVQAVQGCRLQSCGNSARELQSYRAAELQSYRATALQSYRATVLQSYSAAVLQCYCVSGSERGVGDYSANLLKSGCRGL